MFTGIQPWPNTKHNDFDLIYENVVRKRLRPRFPESINRIPILKTWICRCLDPFYETRPFPSYFSKLDKNIGVVDLELGLAEMKKENFKFKAEPWLMTFDEIVCEASCEFSIKWIERELFDKSTLVHVTRTEIKNYAKQHKIDRRLAQIMF